MHARKWPVPASCSPNGSDWAPPTPAICPCRCSLQRDHGRLGPRWRQARRLRCGAGSPRPSSFPDVRKFNATYANYVGEADVLHPGHPTRPDDADNPLRIVYGNEGAPRDLTRFATRFGVTVVDGSGSTEGGVNIARTPDTPEGALGPLPEGSTSRRRHRSAVPARRHRRTGERRRTRQLPRLLQGPRGRGGADGGGYHSGDLAYRDEAGFVHFAGRPVTGCASTVRTSGPPDRAGADALSGRHRSGGVRDPR